MSTYASTANAVLIATDSHRQKNGFFEAFVCNAETSIDWGREREWNKIQKLPITITITSVCALNESSVTK